MTLPQQFRISCFALTLSLYIILGIAHAEQLTITQDPGVIGEPISFVATGELDLDASDGVAEFIVDFSPKFLSNPLGDTPAYSSFRSVSWGNGQDISGMTITEYKRLGLLASLVPNWSLTPKIRGIGDVDSRPEQDNTIAGEPAAGANPG